MCDPILVTLLKMQPHYSQSSRENATPSSDTSPLASYREVPPRGTYMYVNKELETRLQNASQPGFKFVDSKHKRNYIIPGILICHRNSIQTLYFAPSAQLSVSKWRPQL